MRITRIGSPSIGKAAAAQLDQQEQAAIKQVCMQLKTVAPGIGALLRNPNNLNFLMQFFGQLGQNDQALSILRNAMPTIKRAMEKDQTSTMAYIAQT